MTTLANRHSDGVERFSHEAFFYADADDFGNGTASFVREGLDNKEAVLVALPPANLHLLNDALGSDARAVHFLDMTALGGNPARIIPVWAAFADEYHRVGKPFRGIGEPLWPGRPADEVTECHLHERLLNPAFDDGPGWRLMCPYDAARLPAGVVAGAKQSHPVWTTGSKARSSRSYCGHTGAAEAFAQPLTAPPDTAHEVCFGPLDLTAVRDHVARLAITVGLGADRVDELVLAASELATNCVRHGGGQGTVSHWRDEAGLVIEFRDAGVIEDALVGRRLPGMGREGGRGLFIVNQLCDFVQTRSSEAGTTVRITTRLS